MGDPIQALKMRVSGLVERGAVLLSDASTKLQSLQLRIAGEATDDDLEHFEAYGLTSRPRDPAAGGAEAGAAEALALALSGNRDHQIVVMVADRRFRRLGLAKGEVALHNFQAAEVLLDEDGNVVVVPKAGEEVLLGGAGATKEVVRKGDLVKLLKDAVLTANIAGVQAGGGVGPVAITLTLDSADAGENTGGSSVVKAVD